MYVTEDELGAVVKLYIARLFGMCKLYASRGTFVSAQDARDVKNTLLQSYQKLYSDILCDPRLAFLPLSAVENLIALVKPYTLINYNKKDSIPSKCLYRVIPSKNVSPQSFYIAAQEGTGSRDSRIFMSSLSILDNYIMSYPYDLNLPYFTDMHKISSEV